MIGKFKHCLNLCFAWESCLRYWGTGISTHFESSNKNFKVNFEMTYCIALSVAGPSPGSCSFCSNLNLSCLGLLPSS